MRQSAFLRLLALGPLLLLACQEEFPTTLEGDDFPVAAVTAQVTLPYEQFAKQVTVWGGYGRPWELPHGVVARAFGGTLDARTLVALGSYPTVASVRDTTGTIRPDTLLTFIGGRVLAVFDTLDSAHDGPVTLSLGALQGAWDAVSVSWAMAVDTVGERRPWPEEGAGPVLPLATANWDPATGDSVVFSLDSAAVALWADTLGGRRGIRLDAVTEGVRLNVNRVQLSLTTRPRSRPDTLLDLPVSARARTFVYQPFPAVPEGGIRVGGVPAWRTVLELDLPEAVTLTPQLCAQVGCPVTLTPEALVSASLVLHTEAPPPAFQPTDTLRLDVREVLEPSRMPKSPLGFTLAGAGGIRIPPAQFGEQGGVEVEIPLGQYVEALVRARSDSTVQVSTSLALLSAFEPLSLYFGSFSGPGSPNPPQLRLILTLGGGVQIR